MTDKERLEEAKAWRSDLLLTLVTGDLSEKLQNHTRKYKNILNYLIEQAERVQVLESQNNDYLQIIHGIKIISESPFTDFDSLHDAIRKIIEELEESE